MEMDGTVKNKLITLQGLQYVYNAIKEQKTDKHLLYFETNPNRITENGATLTYNKIYQMLMDSPSFVVLVRDNSAYHPNVITGEQIVFISSHVSNGYETMERVSISNENLVTVTNGKAQMYANKTGTINSTNKSDTEKYPSIKAVVDYVGTVASEEALQNAAKTVVIKNKELLRGPIGPRGQNGTLVYYNGLSDEQKAQIDLDEVASSQVEVAKIKQNLQDTTDNFIKKSKTVFNAIDINDSADMNVKDLRVYGYSYQYESPMPDSPSDIINIQNNVIWSTRQDGNIFNPSSFGPIKYKIANGNVVENYGMVLRLRRDAHVGLYGETGLISLTESKYVNRYELNVGTMQTGDYTNIAKKDEIVQPVSLKKDTWYILSTTTKNQQTLNTIKNGLVICYDDVGMPDKYIAPDTMSTIDLSGTTEKPLILRSVPDGNGGQIADWVDLNEGVVHRRVHEVSYTSVSLTSGTTTGQHYATLPRKAKTDNVAPRQGGFLCNMGVHSETSNNAGMAYILANGTQFRIFLNENVVSDSNPLTVAYAIEYEYTESLSDYGIDAQTLHMNYQNTTVINDRENAFHIGYVVNTKEYFDKIHKALIHKTASGEGMISVDDSAEVDAESVRVYGRSWQSGTPAPDAPVSINSVTDDVIVTMQDAVDNIIRTPETANGLESTALRGLYAYTYSKNRVHISGTVESTAIADDVGWYYDINKGFFRVTSRGTAINNGYTFRLPAGQYAIYCSKKGVRIRLYTVVNGATTSTGWIAASGGITNVIYDVDTDVVMQLSFTTPLASSSSPIAIGTTVDEWVSFGIWRIDGASVIPIIGTTKPLILRSVPDGSGGQIADWIDLGAGLVHRLIGAYTFTGSETWTTDTAGRVQTRMASESGILGRAKTGNPWTMSTLYNTQPVYSDGLQMLVRCGATAFIVFSKEAKDTNGKAVTTATANSVASAGQSVQWRLANPFTEPLSDYGIDVQTLRMTYPETTIISGQGAGLEVQYLVDTKTYVDAHSGGAAQQDPSSWNFTTEQQDIARKKIGIQILTQEEYDLISVKDQNTMYVITG